MSEPIGAGEGAMAQAQVKAVLDNAEDLGLTWIRRMATVTGYDDTTPMAIMDGDTVPIAVVSMIGSLYADQRVYVDFVPPAGKYVVGVVAGQIGVRARVTNAPTAVSGVQLTLAWNIIDEESGGNFLAVGGTTFTIPTTGMWAITFQPTLSGVGGARNFASINVTSALTGVPAIFRDNFGAGEDRVALSITIPLLAGDTFTASISQNSGGPLTVAAWLSAFRIGGFTS